MKFKSKALLSSVLSSILIFSATGLENINSYATIVDENEITEKWETIKNMPTGRSDLTSSVVDGKIYCISGDVNAGTRTKVVQVYDPVADTWESKASIPTARENLSSAVVDGKIYCIGGLNGNYLDTVEVYDPATNTWETKTPMPTPRLDFPSVVVDGKIYCIGGSGNGFLSTVEVYDPATDTWETKTPMPTPRRGFAATVVDGKIYCIAGNHNVTAINTVEVYDPVTDAWETKTPKPTPNSYLVGESVNGKIYCIAKNTPVEMYDPATDTWYEMKTVMPTGRGYFTSSVVDGKIYCIGGYDGKNYLNTVEAYTPPKTDTPEYKIEQAIRVVEKNPTEEAMVYARRLINEMPEGELKEQYQARLNAIFPNVALNKQSSSANLDIYIKCENMISLSLDTSSVTFDDFNGTEDLIKENAVNLTVNSSLPYKVDAYLATEIQNASKNKTMDKEILNLKVNGFDEYKSFEDVNTTPITLLDNEDAGRDKTHGIDIMFKGGIPHQKDIYKTTVRFEASQK